MSLEEVWTLTSLFERARDVDDVAELLFERMRQLGFKHVACCNHVDPIQAPARSIVMLNYPDTWVERYGVEKYSEIDPVFRVADAQVAPFHWNNDYFLTRLSRHQKRILGEAADFGLTDGVTFPIHGPRGLTASCSVAFERGAEEPKTLTKAHSLALFAYEAAVKLRLANGLTPVARLGARERECLLLAADGKKDCAIADAMGLSESTVHNMFRNILRKYGVTSRTQALFRAFQTGELTASSL
ncbi:MAG: LuxR family transcriptional regulator [Hyphomonadaceae bacterium]|nr:LuxR family transcriptional regulator [Hyphomonadaceae bacterium]